MKNIRKILDNKFFMLPLLLLVTASGAFFMFAPSSLNGEPNKGLPFKAVKLCTPKVVQVVLQKVIKAALSWIPVVGELIQAVPDKFIPVPCGCDNTLYDSAPTPMNVKDNPFDFLGEFSIPGIDYKLTQSTQKKLEETLTKTLVPLWKEAEKQQAAMIKTDKPENLDVFMTAYKALHQNLVNANALAFATNFETEFNRRYPNMSAHVENMSDFEKRVANDWRKAMDAWMKGLHLTAKNFDEEQKIRNKLAAVILKTYDDTVYSLGQTHMLQYIAAVTAQANGLADRTNTELTGLMEMCATCMQLDREIEAATVHNVTTIAGEARKPKPAATSRKLGF